MVYAIFADYTKTAAHGLIEITFPRTSAIAALSGALGYYAYSYYETWGRGYTAQMLVNYLSANGMSETIATHIVAPAVIPQVSPHIARTIGVIASTSTSLILNLFLMAIYGTVLKKQKEQKTEEPLKEIIIEQEGPLLQESIARLALEVKPAPLPMDLAGTAGQTQMTALNTEAESRPESGQKQMLDEGDADEIWDEEYLKKKLCCCRLWA
jgi:hypothetical protein